MINPLCFCFCLTISFCSAETNVSKKELIIHTSEFQNAGSIVSIGAKLPTRVNKTPIAPLAFCISELDGHLVLPNNRWVVFYDKVSYTILTDNPDRYHFTQLSLHRRIYTGHIESGAIYDDYDPRRYWSLTVLPVNEIAVKKTSKRFHIFSEEIDNRTQIPIYILMANDELLSAKLVANKSTEDTFELHLTRQDFSVVKKVKTFRR